MILIILSFVLWAVIPIISFLSISAATKAGLITGDLILAEILFWLGAIFVGREVVQRYKQKFIGRFKTKPKTEKISESDDGNGKLS